MARPRARSLPKIVIEGVRPELDGGRHAVTRVVGDVIEVCADIYKDGHDTLAARVCFRPENEPTWRHARLRYDYDSDRWSGAFPVDRVGRWLYTVEASFGSIPASATCSDWWSRRQ